MAPLYKAAAAFCLVGLSWLQSEANATEQYKFVTAEVDEDAYLTIKLARNGKISAKTSLVEKDAETVDGLKTTVTGGGTTQNSCEALKTAPLKKLFNVTLEKADKPDYRKMVQKALEAGLEAFGETYPANPSAWQAIWANAELHSVLHLLGADSTKVGCVIGNCVKTSAEQTPIESVLFCELKPAVEENDAVFTEEYFKELKERTTDLEDMKEEDLEDPVVTSSAHVAVPSILTAGLVAILAAISA